MNTPEDCERLLLPRPLRDLEGDPIDLAVRTFFKRPVSVRMTPYQTKIGDDPFNSRPPEQEEVWDARTRLPYNPFISCGVRTRTDTNCPQRERPVTIRKPRHIYPRGLPQFTSGLPAFLNAGKTGFAQAGFNATCENCQSSVTRERLGVAKFTRDAVLDPDDPTHAGVRGKAVYLP